MKRVALVAVALALLGAGEPLATQRKVAGVITAIEPQALTIASSQHTVTGKIDPARTKVTVQGKPGSLGDLKLSSRAKGELCLDDVWLAIDTH